MSVMNSCEKSLKIINSHMSSKFYLNLIDPRIKTKRVWTEVVCLFSYSTADFKIVHWALNVYKSVMWQSNCPCFNMM